MQELVSRLGVDTIDGKLVTGKIFLDSITGRVRDAMKVLSTASAISATTITMTRPHSIADNSHL